MLLIFLFSLFSSSLAIGFTQSAGVEGILRCGDEPAANVLVKLYEHDTISMDELMDSAKSDSQGKFKLSGTADEVSTIEPKLNIYHDCDDGIKPCQRKLTIYLPSKYVSKTKQPSNYFNLGVLQLAGHFLGEDRDCIH